MYKQNKSIERERAKRGKNVIYSTLSQFLIALNAFNENLRKKINNSRRESMMLSIAATERIQPLIVDNN